MEFAACILTQVTKMVLRFNAFRVNIVFDTNPVISINALEHARHVGHNIQKFLRYDPNKELSVYLYRELLNGKISF